MTVYRTIGAGQDHVDLPAFRAWLTSTYGDDLTSIPGGIDATVYDSETLAGTVDFSTLTVSETSPLIIRADTAHEFRGIILVTNVTISTPTNAFGLIVRPNVWLVGLQIKSLAAAIDCHAVWAPSGLDADRCATWSEASAAYARGFAGGGTHRVSNCLAVGYSANGSAGLALGGAGYTVQCTAAGCYYGFRGGGTAAVNCLSVSSTYNYSGTFSAASLNCASDDASVPGAGSGHIANATVVFVDAANDDYHLDATSTDLIDAGADTTGQAYECLTDVDGDARSTTPDIGIDEYVVAGGEPDAAAAIAGALGDIDGAVTAQVSNPVSAFVSGQLEDVSGSVAVDSSDDSAVALSGGLADIVGAVAVEVDNHASAVFSGYLGDISGDVSIGVLNPASAVISAQLDDLTGAVAVTIYPDGITEISSSSAITFDRTISTGIVFDRTVDTAIIFELGG
ncbi:hypothetical protein [Pseudodesulfovibrio karagichevae]|uniref:Uncharacterized protein n=1 Tax=Pseudodesulfovibrio karagichevae TaxID=3239305 RepID=A0ABV4JXF5_9BACT